jgi:hypothetical protein
MFVVFPWLSSLVGVIVSALVTFFASKGGSVLAGFGLSVVAATGITNLVQAIIGDIATVQAMVNQTPGGGTGFNVGWVMFQFAAYCGLPDAINIVVSGAITKVSIAEGRAFVKRMTGA